MQMLSAAAQRNLNPLQWEEGSGSVARVFESDDCVHMFDCGVNVYACVRQ